MIAPLRRAHRRIWLVWVVVVAAAAAWILDPRTGQSPPGFPDSVPAYRLVTEGDLTYLER